ncbi:probable beta-galactosidase [Coccomyxa sp. Obi]|nr:probable beta-galactosidase [Coccomyxa sp. Obi]
MAFAGSSRLARCVALALMMLTSALGDGGKGFWIENDRFVRDGKAVQIISGSIHYFRIHPYYWEDRLLRMKAMGMNTVELYIAWNYHERNPGEYKWDGPQDVEKFIGMVQKLDMLVILRPGPYICAEWDFGGLPAWLGSSAVSGGGTMKLRSSDPLYLAHVDRWWNELLPRMTPLLYSNGGPIVMVQIENEFGFIGPDETYIRHIKATAKNALKDDVILFTTDPPDKAPRGTLTGSELYTAVDFGAGWWEPSQAFGTQKALNAPGMSPAFCSEFYTGWLSRWGEKMANTDFNKFLRELLKILQYNDNSGSVNLYMAHGGTNFGWTAGGQEDTLKDADNKDDNSVQWFKGKTEPFMHWNPVITSYDYDSPISEAGDYGQPGIGPPPDGAPADKFLGIRELIEKHIGYDLPPVPPRPRIEAYGEVTLSQQATLLSQLGNLVIGPGIYSETPEPMEEYGQWHGLILYRASVDASELRAGATLFVGSKVRDSAVIMANGVYVGSLERDGDLAVVFNEAADQVARANDGQSVELDILVMQIGRSNFGNTYDLKGLVSDLVLLNTKPLKGWRVFPMPLLSLDSLQLPEVSAAAAPAAAPSAAAAAPDAAPAAAAVPAAAPSVAAAAAASLAVVLPAQVKLAKEMEAVARSADFPAISAMVASDGGLACSAAPAGNGTAGKAPSPATDGPTFFRGYFNVNSSLANADGVFPDTYINVGKYSWAKGVAFINGFNLGYYWPEKGPANTMYLPGPLLKACNNELILLELGTSMKADASAKVLLTDQADLYGPPANNNTRVESSEGSIQNDPAYFANTGAMGGHMIPVMSQE